MKKRKAKSRKLYGWGINDTYNQTKTKQYSVWSNMVRRCYSKECLKKHPTYKGCSVHPDWKYFSNFKQWMDKQDWEGKYLDKDLLVYGNKVYGPDTCIFVPRLLNNLFTDKGSGPYNKGVYKHGKGSGGYNKKGGMFVAQISMYGKQKCVSYHTNEKDAEESYKKHKREYLKELANKQEDDRLVKALLERIDLYL